MNIKLLVWKTKYAKKLHAAIKLLFVTDKQSFNYLSEGILISSRVGNGLSHQFSPVHPQMQTADDAPRCCTRLPAGAGWYVL